MIKEKVEFTGLEIDTRELLGREISPPWPKNFYLLPIVNKNYSYNFSVENIRKWLSKNTTGRYGVIRIHASTNSINDSTIVAFEDPNEAMIFKLAGIDQIEKESLSDDFF